MRLAWSIHTGVAAAMNSATLRTDWNESAAVTATSAAFRADTRRFATTMTQSESRSAAKVRISHIDVKLGGNHSLMNACWAGDACVANGYKTISGPFGLTMAATAPVSATHSSVRS